MLWPNCMFGIVDRQLRVWSIAHCHGKAFGRGSLKASKTVDAELLRLDRSFAAGGTINPTLVYANYAQNVAVESDGKNGLPGATPSTASVARYNVDGSVDTSFGSDGIATLSLGPTAFGFNVNQIVVNSSGTIIVDGTMQVPGEVPGPPGSQPTPAFLPTAFIAELTADGQQT